MVGGGGGAVRAFDQAMTIYINPLMHAPYRSTLISMLIFPLDRTDKSLLWLIYYLFHIGPLYLGIGLGIHTNTRRYIYHSKCLYIYIYIYIYIYTVDSVLSGH